jgi:hypothetical protein
MYGTYKDSRAEGYRQSIRGTNGRPLELLWFSSRTDALQDGFHFAKKALATFPCHEPAFRRLGAPVAFDADAPVEVVVSLKSSAVTEIDNLQLGLGFLASTMQSKIQYPMTYTSHHPRKASLWKATTFFSTKVRGTRRLGCLMRGSRPMCF